MVLAIQSVQFKEWVHEHVKRPYLEGFERIQRAWHGVDFHSIYTPRLTWKDRAVSLLAGLLLLIPFFNAVVWKGWETLGKPEILSSTYDPGDAPPPIDADAPPQEAVEIHVERAPPPAPAAAPAPAGVPLEVDQFQHSESNQGDPAPVVCDWRVERYPDRIFISKHSSVETVAARYSPEWVLQDYDLVSADGQSHFHARLAGRKIHLSATDPTHHIVKDLVLKEPYPWIQQSTFGLRQFAVNPRERQFNFYGINPIDLSLAHIVARKEGEEEVAGFGRLLKIKLSLTGLKSLVWSGHLWADPHTGHVRKLESKIAFRPLTTILFVQNHP